VTVNHRFCGRARPAAFGLVFCAALAALTLPLQANAQFTGKASATGQYETDSNVFDLPSGVPPPGGNDAPRGDTFFAYGAQMDGNYSLGRQELYVTANTREYDYQRYTFLDHDDYRLDGGLNWKLGGLFDGKFDVARSHSMVPFYNLSGSIPTLSLVTEQKETVQVGLLLNPNWKVETSAYTSKSDQPVPDAPKLQLTQNAGTAAIDYLGIAGLTSGLTAGYLSGNYSGLTPGYLSGDYTGVAGAADSSFGQSTAAFTQSTAGFFAKYKLSRTTVDGQIGYSRRASDIAFDNTSGVTGLLDFTDQLTPKTSFTAKIDRTINSYLLNAGSEIDTEIAASFTWQATYKLSVSPGYSFAYRNFPGQGNNPVGSDRVDIQEIVTLDIDYRPQSWLLIRPYANVQTRRSTYIGGHYSASIFGVSFTVTPFWSKAPRR
jgi:hypothetical protein